MSSPRILAFAGSARRGSLNQRLIDVCADRLERKGAEVTRLRLSDYPLPIYDGDLEAADGTPEAARRLHAQLCAHQGVIIASPEYNAMASPLLINALAWVSRIKTSGGARAAFGAPIYALVSASPGGFGGYRGLMSLHQALVTHLQAHVAPPLVSVPQAERVIGEDGEIDDPRTHALLEQLFEDFLTQISAVESRSCQHVS